MGYRTEFPHYDPQTLPKIPMGWKDVSWHNDCCPSWQVGDYVVFIDFADPDDRELFGMRFAVNTAETCENVLETDNWQEVVDCINKLTA